MTPSQHSSLASVVSNAVPLRLTFTTDDPGLTVLSAEGSAAMSALFRVVLVVQHVDPALSPASFVSRPAALHLDAEPGGPVLRGVVRSFRQLTVEPGGVSRYEVILVPALALLALRTDAWIFSQENAVAILQDCLSMYEGMALPPKRVVGEETLPIHEYRVQYLETDLEFIFRILAEDGVATHFDVFSECELVLSTDTRTQAPEPAFSLPFASASSMSASVEHAHAVEVGSAQTALKQAVEDQWLEQPRFSAYVELPSVDGPLLRYLFAPGVGATEAELSAHAEELFWAEHGQANRITVRSTAYVPPGHRLQLQGAPRPEAEGELLVVEVESRWSGGHDGTPFKKEHVLSCLPLDVRFVPRRPPKRRIPGLQKATIVGEGEIDVDELGRVLCELRWAEDCVTRRVLVSQAWAGPGYGHYVNPRVGDEVLIAYLDGDPNEPIVVGRLNNAMIPPAVSLPRDKTVSLWRTKSSPGGEGYNEIRMDDLAGEELFSMHAQRDFFSQIERDSETLVKRNYKVKVEGDIETNVVGSTTHSAGVSSTFLVPNFLVVTEELGLVGDNTRMNAAFRTDDITFVLNVTAQEEYHHNSGCWQMQGGKFHVFAEEIVFKAGGSSIVIKDGGIEIQSGGPVVVKGAPIKLNC